ncbi:MAG: exodeoxyribonuclease VII small subunit [Synechococcales bacterium]|nr:exodeoxyribonuclease VII small subunit [Synechococcales bacterium]
MNSHSSPSPHVSPAAASPSAVPPGWSYEATVARVENLILQIESGNLELAEVFDQFAIAIRHLQECESFLNHHRQEVDLLIETLYDRPEEEERF